ncbi:MAG: hypothetical protein WCA19_27490 [Candidatus Acidiferrales bacterium]
MTTETALREKLKQMCDQLQIFEMSAGWLHEEPAAISGISGTDGRI